MQLMTKRAPVYHVVRVCGAVIGCVDPVVPRGANMTRSGDKAVISCRATAQTWHIVCQGSVWYGKVDNCTTSKQNTFSGLIFTYPPLCSDYHYYTVYV